ncbi:hypothetical protein TrLO_g4328 [Triparma laevis f. longispina]|uniref:Uncharacterized protein n=1 Tax=Triparma laevis f. longispina TaxID=1714387 RepID=A0A9W7KWX2_9STRA|nr:hypothetical protein TrLO_g4328 [Triparma laevis f. longispina]
MYSAYDLDKFENFWTMTLYPITLLSMAISFALKPRNNTYKYRAFLYFQFLSYWFSLVATSKNPYFYLAVDTPFVFFMLWVAEKTRASFATFSDEKLSVFLTQTVLKRALFFGLAQLVFLIFSSIQCDNESETWEQCNRTLYAQTGLGYFVVLGIGIKMVSEIAPKQYLDRHVVSMKKVLAMKLTVGEFVQFNLLLISAGCGMFLLGNYGAKGDFKSEAEQQGALTVATIGSGCLTLVGLWKFFVIRSEMRRDEGGKGAGDGEEEKEEVPLTEAHSFWFYTGAIGTLLQSGLGVLGNIDIDSDFHQALATLVLPFVALGFCASVFCQPRRCSEGYMRKLKVVFFSFCVFSEIAWGVRESRRGQALEVASHLLRIAAQLFLFSAALKLRATVGKLNDEDTETFLVDVIFKGGIQTLFSVLFLTFRTTKCIFEKGGLEQCKTTAACTTFISLYLMMWWGVKAVQGSIEKKWRHNFILSIEKIATMEGISFRRKLQGFMTLLSCICGIFLFSMVTAEDISMDQFSTAVTIVGFTGVFTSFVSFANEIYSRLKLISIQKGRRGSVKIVEEGKIPVKVTVTECASIFIQASVVFTTLYVGFLVCYAVTLEKKYWLIAYLVLPFTTISYILGFFMKPQRVDNKYRYFLKAHFLSFVLLSETAAALGDFRLGKTLSGCFAIGRCIMYGLFFRIGLRLRKAASQLPPEQLSRFLTKTVLLNGTACLGPIVFFSFETISCFIGQGSIDNGNCTNTSRAVLYLSSYLLIMTAMSIGSNSIALSAQRYSSWTYEEVATLKVRWWQKVQGGLLLSTALCSLYLLTALGVEGDENSLISLLGIVGGTTISAVVLMNILIWTQTHRRYLSEGRDDGGSEGEGAGASSFISTDDDLGGGMGGGGSNSFINALV